MDVSVVIVSVVDKSLQVNSVPGYPGTKLAIFGIFFGLGGRQGFFWLKFLRILKRFLSPSAPNIQNRACFYELVEMSPRSALLQSKLTKS